IEAKTDAEALADGWRTAIREGTFRRRTDPQPVIPSTSDAITLEKFGAKYAERLGRPVSVNHRACFRQFCAFTAPGTETKYGARVVTAFTEDDIEVFFAHLHAKG